MALSLVLLISLASVYECQETFDYPAGSEGGPRWAADSVMWESHGGKMHFQGGSLSMLELVEAPHAKVMSMEAVVTVRKREPGDWGVAGIGFRRDGANYWHLALVEAPERLESGHRVELVEKLEGRWLAQNAATSRLKRLSDDGVTFHWEYNHPYRLCLDLDEQGLRGRVLELDGRERAHLAYAFSAPAVETGQPFLDTGGFQTSFESVKVKIAASVPPPSPEQHAPRAYEGKGYEAIQAEATGFFYPKEIDKRWWMIDPKGHAFFMVGTDHINYTVHWCEKLACAPYAQKMKALHGSENAWAEETATRLGQWGFNTLPANHSTSLRYRDFPHIEFLTFGSSFSNMDALCPKTTWTGFPNVFSEKWPRHCDKMAQRRCAAQAQDPWLIGYFLDNELEWYGKSHRDEGLFQEAWKRESGHSAKQAWIDFLAQEGIGPKEFEEDWGVSAPSMEALAEHCDAQATHTKRGKETARRFVRLVAEKYFQACHEAIRRYDPHHLILGNRYAGRAPDIWDITGKYCDVVSFNMYPRVVVGEGILESTLDTIRQWQEKANRPMMITEWSFPALDSGLPCEHGAGMRVDTQVQKAQCYAWWQQAMFSLPFMVGSNYFMWVDEPALGISAVFPEDSNYGLVRESGEPYAEFVAAVSKLNRQVYAMHEDGSLPPLAKGVGLAPWLREGAQAKATIPAAPLVFEQGDFRIKGPVDGVAWKFYQGATYLGSFQAVMHQALKKDRWLFSSEASLIFVGENSGATVVEMLLSHPGEESDASGGRSYQSAWRFWIPASETGCLGAACLWVENTEEEPWFLERLYPYFMPGIGGANSDDEPLAKRVPNYYQRGGAWVDEQAGLGVAAWYPFEEAYHCHYWKGKAGSIHSDLSMTVKVELAPKTRFSPPFSPAFFFPLEQIDLEGFSQAIGSIQGVVLQGD